MKIQINVGPGSELEDYMVNSPHDPLNRKLYIECSDLEIGRAAKEIVEYCAKTEQDFVDLQIENWEAPIWAKIYAALPETFRHLVHLDEKKAVCGRNLVFKRGGFAKEQ